MTLEEGKLRYSRSLKLRQRQPAAMLSAVLLYIEYSRPVIRWSPWTHAVMILFPFPSPESFRAGSPLFPFLHIASYHLLLYRSLFKSAWILSTCTRVFLVHRSAPFFRTSLALSSLCTIKYFALILVDERCKFLLTPVRWSRYHIKLVGINDYRLCVISLHGQTPYLS